MGRFEEVFRLLVRQWSSYCLDFPNWSAHSSRSFEQFKRLGHQGNLKTRTSTIPIRRPLLPIPASFLRVLTAIRSLKIECRCCCCCFLHECEKQSRIPTTRFFILFLFPRRASLVRNRSTYDVWAVQRNRKKKMSTAMTNFTFSRNLSEQRVALLSNHNIDLPHTNRY